MAVTGSRTNRDREQDTLQGAHRGSVVALSDDGRCAVRVGEPAERTVWARPTRGCAPGPGDRVLVTGTADGEVFVLAALGAGAAQAALEARSGARAERIDDASGERLVVRDATGRLLFEYDTERGRSVVHSPEGDLALMAPSGAIELDAAHGVQCRSAGPIDLASQMHVGIKVVGVGGGAGTRLDMTGDRLALAGRRLAGLAERADLRFDRLRFRGTRLEAQLDRIRVVGERLDTLVRNLVERIGRSDRRVEETDRRRAGRVVDEIEGDHVVTSGESTVRARGTYRLDGDQINLG